jgi:hypothetical protein
MTQLLVQYRSNRIQQLQNILLSVSGKREKSSTGTSVVHCKSMFEDKFTHSIYRYDTSAKFKKLSNVQESVLWDRRHVFGSLAV